MWEYVNHPDYNKDRGNDISLVFLEIDITHPDFAPICFDSVKYDINNSTGQLISYGETELNEIGKIKRLDLRAVSNSECKLSNVLFLNEVVKEENFCAGTGVAGAGPCFGDSGAGFMVQESGKWYVRGILSEALKDIATNSCDTTNYAIFVDIFRYSPWITKKIGPKKVDSTEKNPLPLCDTNNYNFEFSFRPKDQYWVVSIVSLTSGIDFISVENDVFNRSIEVYLGMGAVISTSWVLTSTFGQEIRKWYYDNLIIRNVEGNSIYQGQYMVGHYHFSLEQPEAFNVVLLKISTTLFISVSYCL